jgi:hypothetical protein
MELNATNGQFESFAIDVSGGEQTQGNPESPHPGERPDSTETPAGNLLSNYHWSRLGSAIMD